MRRPPWFGIGWLYLTLFLAACSGQSPSIGGGRARSIPSAAASGDADLAAAVSWMTGSFSSAEQARADASFYDVRLRMVSLWPDRTDCCWLYVEQAIAGEQQPYRQRIYHVTRAGGDTIASAVYELPDPARFVGAWRDPAIFGALTPDSLVQREGCVIHLRRESPERFAGATHERDCKSSLRGASYAVSEVVLTPGSITTWDRGYDETGSQVWGAERGGYVFKRVARDPRDE